ncbi:GNAT family acetyltransferase [Rhizoctonia solani]|uniref:GNAT family acetyltransferase n=1 Tax=Rhizoctonia solani TaxID=456999 RepID=A0A8H8T0V1_9AGAM|nr:GNAT family acetyltransferase [Rhizoctonia solani]QRW23848.1 GNAT family acetyltransferase [Rhizoctonia solani]
MLRPATQDDLPTLHIIRNAAQDSLIQTGSLQVLSGIECVEHYMLFSSLQLGPIGMCRLDPRAPSHIEPWLSPRPDIYLSSLIVHPKFQSRGLGKQLVSELQVLGKSMALDVWAGNDKLQRWYQHLGWKHVATVQEGDHDQTYDVAVYVWP